MKDVNTILAEALNNLPKQPDYFPVRTIHVQNYSRPIGPTNEPFGWEIEVDQNNNILGIFTNRASY